MQARRWMARPHYTAIIQADSAGTMIDASVLKRAARQSETIRVALVRQEHILAAQTQQVAACNALHELEERLSRWLLQSRDLLMSDTLPLTQEFLSQMLGVQRSSVTLVARKLQEAGLISYRRGRIQVLDVEGLQDSRCECYPAINVHFHRSIGWSPNGDNQAPHTPPPPPPPATDFSSLFSPYVRFPTKQLQFSCVGQAEVLTMARYYFHIKDGADSDQRPRRYELATPDAARVASPEVRTGAVG